MITPKSGYLGQPQRDFIETDNYFGPERRRRDSPTYMGSERRKQAVENEAGEVGNGELS
jgi:hypothetical protein